MGRCYEVVFKSEFLTFENTGSSTVWGTNTYTGDSNLLGGILILLDNEFLLKITINL